MADRVQQLELPTTRDPEGLARFAAELERIGEQIGFKISARGWCYQLEQFLLITKGQFNRAETLINKCRKQGYLPIDFTAEEEARRFSVVEMPEVLSPVAFMKRFLEDALHSEDFYMPDWWDGEEYYLQMVVEKIDLKTLFEPVCRQYHIPIATSKGWSSMLQRGEYAQRFNDAEQRGLKCALLYCGDHDPDGLRISEFLRSNLEDLINITWEGGDTGYDPSGLIIDRFGLNYDFIQANQLTWIDNLETASGKDLASPSHPNHYMPYVQDYLEAYGSRKCEANALVIIPAEAERLCIDAIEAFVGEGAPARFSQKRADVLTAMDQLRDETGLGDALREAVRLIEE